MSIAVARYKTVYVLYPRGMRSGGPEALHQLVDELRTQGQEAYLVPTSDSREKERVEEYKWYNAPEAADFIDAESNAVVFPELYLQQMRRVRRAQRICWWLSIDRSIAFRFERERNDRKNGIPSELSFPPLRRLREEMRSARPHRALIRSARNLTQSHYAAEYIGTNFDCPTWMVSDYIRDDRLGNDSLASITERPKRIAFNPAKGATLTSMVQQRVDPDVEWCALRNMTPEQVGAALRDSMIYLDLGPQPGRDRLPREAALMGAISIVAQRGAGGFAADTPLSSLYRLEVVGVDFAQQAADLIESIFENPSYHYESQGPFRDAIAAGRKQFSAEVAHAFGLEQRAGGSYDRGNAKREES